MKIGKRVRIYGSGVLLIAALNIIAWNSTGFCDWYIATIFPIWVNTWGRVTGLFPFSVGEWMILAGLTLVLFAMLTLLVFAGFALRGAFAKKQIPKRLAHFTKSYFRFFSWTILAVCLVMTLNCFLLYHASTFSETYFGEEDSDYTISELLSLYNKVAERCNALSEEMERDETGMVVYTGSEGNLGEASFSEQLTDMAEQARKLMQELGEKYAQLDGWYPRPKVMFFSDFMCQQHMQGYYFPFSMEANYNDVMHPLNIPSTMCHELAHLRGYIYEDEANFIGYLACVQSDNAFIEYAGYLSVLNYLYNDIYKAYQDEQEAFVAAATENPPVAVKDQVWEDNVFVSDEDWDRINGKALIDTETVDKAADAFIDTNLKVNGISDGKVSYSRVVILLLQYERKMAGKS